MKNVQPYLNFAGNTEEAFNYYRQVFGGDFEGIYRFRDFAGGQMELPEADLDKVAHVGLRLGPNVVLMGTDVLESLGQALTVGNNSYIHLEAESSEEAERLFSALADGGTVEMELARTEWSELYGSCVDRFGVQWMVDYTGNVQLAPPAG